MTVENNFADEISELIACYTSGTATDAQFARLERMLEASADARALYVDTLDIHANLYWTGVLQREAAAAAGVNVDTDDASAADDSIYPLAQTPSEIEPDRPSDSAYLLFRDPLSAIQEKPAPRWQLTYPRTAMIFLTGMLAGLLISFWRPATKVGPIAGSAQSKAAIAAPTVCEITGLADCRWPSDSLRSFMHDRAVVGQRFKLASGFLELTYDTGAKVILQGPAAYEIDSNNSGFISSGKLTGQITSETARGFTIRTPTARVIDLGTEFGVDVDKGGRTVSHVFRGEVRLLAGDSDTNTNDARELTLRAKETGKVERQTDDARQYNVARRDPVQPQHFLRTDGFNKRAADYYLKSFRAWKTYRETIRRDPSLLAYYDFQQVPNQPQVLANVAASANRTADGVIVGAFWTEGRMPGKHALRFTGETDCVRLNVARQTNDLTVSAWVYVESLGNENGGLLMSDDWRTPGQVHWQVGFDGGMCCDIAGVKGQKSFHGLSFQNLSSPLLDVACVHRWAHLAMVYYQSTGDAMFYRDGRLLETLKAPGNMQERVPIRIGPATIGRWNHAQKDPTVEPRSFHGRIDEMAIFGRPLPPDEIYRMYQTGMSTTTDSNVARGN
jgi:hypothetical protein